MSEVSAGKLVAAIYRNTQALMDQLGQSTGLTSGTLDFFYVIMKREGLSQKELGETLRIGKATTTKAVKKLIDAGYVEKKKSMEDSRVYELYLTDRGRGIENAVEETFKFLMKTYKRGFDTRTYEAMLSSLEKVLNNVVEENQKGLTPKSMV